MLKSSIQLPPKSGLSPCSTPNLGFMSKKIHKNRCFPFPRSKFSLHLQVSMRSSASCCSCCAAAPELASAGRLQGISARQASRKFRAMTHSWNAKWMFLGIKWEESYVGREIWWKSRDMRNVPTSFLPRTFAKLPMSVKQPKKTRVEIEMPWLLHIEMLDSSLPKLLPSQHCQGKASLWPSPSARV